MTACAAALKQAMDLLATVLPNATTEKDSREGELLIRTGLFPEMEIEHDRRIGR